METEILSELKEAVVLLQRENLTLQDKLSAADRKYEKREEELLHEIISHLDLIEMAEKSPLDQGNAQVYLRKLKKRLQKTLKSRSVIEFRAKVAEPLTKNLKVVETRAEDRFDSGVVLDCVRAGYLQNGKVLRPCEVISNKKVSEIE